MDSAYYNPPTTAILRDWIIQYFPTYATYISAAPNYAVYRDDGSAFVAYDFTVPSSPQAYSNRMIIFTNESNQLMVISMYDYQATSASFYDAWLTNFIY
jgi:hypothetical protein